MTRPTEAGGGVLADEMGMGKTLSTLALITSTSQEGHEWAHEHQQQDIDMYSSVKRYTQSTLVIVPSARWSPLSNLEESIILAKSRLVLINSWKKEISK
jgi:SNF2 family DNA or RNA helicase